MKCENIRILGILEHFRGFPSISTDDDGIKKSFYNIVYGWAIKPHIKEKRRRKTAFKVLDVLGGIINEEGVGVRLITRLGIRL